MHNTWRPAPRPPRNAEARSDVKILEYRNHGLNNILSAVNAINPTHLYKSTLNLKILIDIIDNDIDESERIR
jgi:hypothetical protein